jgi:DNA primase
VASVKTESFEFDIAEYLELRGINYKRSGKNLMMSCPFHEDKHPSFGINIFNGKYHCLAGSCNAYGNLAGLVKKIEGLPSYDAAEAWLRGNYGINPDIIDQPITLVFRGINEEEEIVFIPEDTLKQWDYRHPYLEGRGIPDIWQRRFRIGYDPNGQCITLLWYDRLGRCVGAKKRSVYGKFFWTYHLSSVGPNKITLYGINHVFRKRATKVVIVESEIDAVYLWANGFPAVALGTSHVTKAQLNELMNCPIEQIVIGTDNDAAGRKICQELIKKITWIPDIKIFDWSQFPQYKDVNELDKPQLEELVGNAISVIEHSINERGI